MALFSRGAFIFHRKHQNVSFTSFWCVWSSMISSIFPFKRLAPKIIKYWFGDTSSCQANQSGMQRPSIKFFFRTQFNRFRPTTPALQQGLFASSRHGSLSKCYFIYDARKDEMDPPTKRKSLRKSRCACGEHLHSVPRKAACKCKCSKPSVVACNRNWQKVRTSQLFQYIQVIDDT